jgi:hypothetical protein
MDYLGVAELKEIATSFNGSKDEFGARAFTDALDGLKDRLSSEKFNEFAKTL